MRKLILSSALLFSLAQDSYAKTEFLRDGRCSYIITDGKKVGEMCSAARPISSKEIAKRISSLDIEGIVSSEGIKPRYGGFDTPTLIKAIISVENSAVDPDAISPAGAVGLMQLMPETALMTEYELRDPRKNIIAGITHFGSLYEVYQERYGNEAIPFACAAYLVGRANLEKVIRNHNVKDWKSLETVTDLNMGNLSDSNGTTVVDYAQRIISNYSKLRKK